MKFNSSIYHLVYLILFSFIAIASFLMLLQSFSQADDVPQDAIIINTPPTIATPSVGYVEGTAITSFSITESSTRNLVVYGTASDYNGCQDLLLVNTKVFRSTVVDGVNCSLSNANCYSGSTATFSGCTGSGDVDATYAITIPLQYYIDPTESEIYQPTNWTVSVQPKDASGQVQTEWGGSEVSYFEVAATAALDVTSSITYGSISVGGTGAERFITFTNKGNATLDAQYAATSADAGNMVCNGVGSANIPVGNARVSLSTGFAYSAGGPLSAINQTLDLNLAKRTQAAVSEKNAYFLLQLPSTGIKGTCSNTITFTAVQG